MSNPSIEQLLAWMKDKSKTWGWGAMVAYDRRKANELLHQLYVERFDSDSYLPLINETMDSSDYHNQHLSNLKFAAPRLSFENADLTKSEVTLTLDFVGGLIVTESLGVGISKVQKILPLNSPHLSMTQPLLRVPGEVDSDGTVSLNLANKVGANYKANFVVADLDQERLGRQFGDFFENKVPDEAKVFQLGTLSGATNGALTPEGFQILTMAAPGARVRGAPNEGDGAVLVFVRMNGHFSGKEPGDDFMYPIPADTDGNVYTGSVWVSNRTLFDEMIRPLAEADMGHGIRFAAHNEDHNLAWPLVASEGGIPAEKVELNNYKARLRVRYSSPFAGYETRLEIRPQLDSIQMQWDSYYHGWYDYYRDVASWPDEWETGPTHCYCNALMSFRTVLDEKTGVVSFVRDKGTDPEKPDPEKYRFALKYQIDKELHHFTDDKHQSKVLGEKMEEQILTIYQDFLATLRLPDVDTFLVSNLLFPGHNALQLTDVHVPGDLALFGHIDPLRTTAVITPRQATVAAGGSQAFSLGANVSGVTWSLRGTDPDDEDAGSISPAGLYTAPAASKLPKGYLAAVLTGRGTLDGEEVQSSALVTVLASTVALNPLFQVCDEGESVELSAEMLQGEEPDWWLKDTSLGGKLSTNKGNTCTYTAAELSSTREPIYIDTVLAGRADGTYAESMVMVFNRTSNLKVVISEDSDPASGTVQLQVVLNGVPENPDVKGIECRLLAGGGTLTQEGVYQQAPGATGCAVVALVIDDGWDLFAGYIAMPLPLTTYGEINQRVSRSISERSVHPAPSGRAR